MSPFVSHSDISKAPLPSLTSFRNGLKRGERANTERARWNMVHWRKATDRKGKVEIARKPGVWSSIRPSF